MEGNDASRTKPWSSMPKGLVQTVWRINTALKTGKRYKKHDLKPAACVRQRQESKEATFSFISIKEVKISIRINYHAS